VNENVKRIVILTVIAVGAFLPGRAQVRVACLGNSITAGSGLDRPGIERYPAVLERLLGNGFEVGVFARGGMCLQRHAEISFWYSTQFRDARDFDPDIAVLLLGTNDSKYYNWGNCSTFTADYADLLDSLSRFESSPTVIPVLPPHAFTGLGRIDSCLIRDSIVPIIRVLADERSLQYVDAHTLFSQHEEYYSDGIHPNALGSEVLANLVYEALGEITLITREPGSLYTAQTPDLRAINRLLVFPGCRSPVRAGSLFFDLRGRCIGKMEGTVPVIGMGYPSGP